MISPQGEFLADAGEKIDKIKAMEIEDAGVMFAFVDVDGNKVKVVSNGMVDIKKYVDFDCTPLVSAKRSAMLCWQRSWRSAAMMKRH